MPIDYSASGFAREPVQDYGDFELIGKLRELENSPQISLIREGANGKKSLRSRGI